MITALGFRVPRTYVDHPRTWFETLETRRLFSAAANGPVVMLDDANHPVATLQIVDGVLNVVTGDGADDVMLGTAKDHPEQIFVYVNYVRAYFSRADITAVSIDLGDGDDGFGFQDFDGLVNLPTTINGGAGDDGIGGEDEFNYVGDGIQDLGDAPFAPIHLIGGQGNDTLVGGIGDTVAEGGPGTNLMYGRKGLFTILDPPPETPIANPIDNGDASPGTFPITFFPTADPIIGIPSVTNEQPMPTPSPAPTEGPQTKPSTATAAVPAPQPIGSSEIHRNSLLISDSSLMDQRAEEIWQ